MPIANFKIRSKRSRLRRRAISLGVVAALAVALAAAWQSGGARHPKAPVAAKPRPTPTPEFGMAAPLHRSAPWSLGERSSVRATIEAALLPIARKTSSFGVVVRAQDGSILYARNRAVGLSPASTQKLIVAATALGVLGPQFHFHTLLALAPSTSDGAPGDAYLIGSGDPSLTYGDLRAAAKLLAKRGVRRLRQVVVDGSAISGNEINPHWNAADLNEDFEAATSGMSLDQDTVEFHIRGGSPGSAAAVTLEPPSSAVHWTGSVRTSDADDAVIAATQTADTFRISGSVPPSADETFYVPVHGIPQYVAAVFDRMLHDAGIRLESPARTGRAPLDATVVWNHRSSPVRVLVGRMLYQSNNHFAEQVLRAVGGASGAAAND
ncbi:MAG: D-alanyl-D-alanine carboxypeptidase/D-alanyl-D-alanine-endopeptidase, partial [Candidatus Eremiobacteraeota bacterium]|nr:D-alanyl-D-alanine carboxypeptidase/D-alanyl-D-alanine-endopeptidase [Candidatus Eremiobacteraeota bacterium]